MGCDKTIVEQQVRDLRDYTDTVAAVHLLKEALTQGAAITIGAAEEIVAIENLSDKPKIGNVIKAIIAKAGTPGSEGKWAKNSDDQWHFIAAITIGGAIYTVDLIQNETSHNEKHYTVKIESKLTQSESEIGRGKLYFNPGHTATIQLTENRDGDLFAVSRQGLAIDETSFIPRAYQNEILAKFTESILSNRAQRLAILGTGAGKGVIIAGIAQAVGRTVMIVPDKSLVDQQSAEVHKMLGDGLVRGEKKFPTIFTLDTLSTLFDFDFEHLSEQELDQIKASFRNILQGNASPNYDQIILESEHPLFKILAMEIKDAMVLIDESHQHTFTSEGIDALMHIKEQNSVLALTATPTSKLYDIFPGEPLDDFSLGAAIDLGIIRPIKPEVAYLEQDLMVTSAVTNYFNDYYLTEGNNGYVDPKTLKQSLLEMSDISDAEAQEIAIEQALRLNCMRGQRNMSFSDDKDTRLAVLHAYEHIETGDEETINHYKVDIARLRREAEIEARLDLTLKFLSITGEEAILALRKKIAQETPLRDVDLVADIRAQQQNDIQRTINSYALALILGDKPEKVAEKDRSHKLQHHLHTYSKAIQDYHPSDEHGTNKLIPKHLLSKFQTTGSIYRDKLQASLLKLGPSISKLPTDQRNALITLILDRAEELASQINFSLPISEIILDASPVDLAALCVEYASAVDVTTPDEELAKQLAQIELGLKTHLVSDMVLATGVNKKDILNVQILNQYSPVVEQDQNVINGTLSGPQAAGRCVRHDDVAARVQQYIDKRYEHTGLILHVSAMIDPRESAKATKDVMLTRDITAQKQEKSVLLLQRGVRAMFYSKALQQIRTEVLPEINVRYKEEKQTLEEKLQTAKALLADNKHYLETTGAKLRKAEIGLAYIPGNPNGPVPPKYRNDSLISTQWMTRKTLPTLIDKIQAKVLTLEESIRQTSRELDARRKQFIDSVEQVYQPLRRK